MPLQLSAPLSSHVIPLPVENADGWLLCWVCKTYKERTRFDDCEWPRLGKPICCYNCDCETGPELEFQFCPGCQQTKSHSHWKVFKNKDGELYTKRTCQECFKPVHKANFYAKQAEGHFLRGVHVDKITKQRALKALEYQMVNKRNGLPVVFGPDFKELIEYVQPLIEGTLSLEDAVTAWYDKHRKAALRAAVNTKR